MAKLAAMTFRASSKEAAGLACSRARSFATTSWFSTSEAEVDQFLAALAG